MHQFAWRIAADDERIERAGAEPGVAPVLDREEAGGRAAGRPTWSPDRPGRAPFAPEPVLVVLDRRELSRACTGRWLLAEFPELTVRLLRDAAEIGAQLGEAAQVRLVLLHLGAGRAGAPPAAAELARVHRLLPGVPVVVFSDLEGPEHVEEAFEQPGVRGYVPTSTPAPNAAAALRLVASGGTYVPASLLGAVPALAPGAPRPGGQRLDSFTRREAEVLDALRQGKTNKVIAYELNMSENTVKVHIRHIMRKLGATNRTQVAMLTRHLLDPAG